MKILNSIPPKVDTLYAKDQCLHSIYHVPNAVEETVKNKLISGKTVILFSGGFRLSLNGQYIEPKMFEDADLPWQKGTIFIDPSNKQILEYTLNKLDISNLVILNSTVFIKYRSWDKIQNDINKFKHFTKQVIVSIPVDRMDFNRLKYSNEAIASKLKGTLIEDNIIICQ